MTLSVYILNKEKIRKADFANPFIISEEMRERKDETLWIYANESVDMFTLQDIFGLHPLTVDAVIHENQPSKIEEYERYIFTIIDGIEYNTNNTNDVKHELIEDDLYVFLGNRWIITINFHNRNFEENIRKKIRSYIQKSSSRAVSSKTQSNKIHDTSQNNRSPLSSLMQSQNKPLESSSTNGSKTLQHELRMNEILYCIALDEMLSSYIPKLDDINKQLDETEERILADDPSSKSKKLQQSDIMRLRRKISFIKGGLDMVSRAFEETVSGINTNTNVFSYGEISSNKARLSNESIREISVLNDRTNYLRNDLENMHQRIISLREAYNSNLNSNLSETIRTLTVIATIILPLTLITGIYGMNFAFMPEIKSPYGYFYVLCLLGVVGGGTFMYFKRKGWA